MPKEAMRILFVFLMFLMIGSGINAETLEGVDPITNEKYQLEKTSAGAWDIFTSPNASENLVMVTLKNRPVISANNLGGKSSVTVHDRKNSSLSSVDVYDNNNDGVYDHIRVYQQDGTYGFVDLNLINGEWHYKAYSSSAE